MKSRSSCISKTKTPRSAPLSSSRPIKTPRNPIDLYLRLSRNAQKRNFKLDRFFGENEDRPRVDACTIQEALDHGLAGGLSSKRVLSYFFLYLLEVSPLYEALTFRRTLSRVCASCSRWSISRTSRIRRSKLAKKPDTSSTILISIQQDCCI